MVDGEDPATLTPTERERLTFLRWRVEATAYNVDFSPQDARRLAFARWLVRTQRLSEHDEAAP